MTVGGRSAFALTKRTGFHAGLDRTECSGLSSTGEAHLGEEFGTVSKETSFGVNLFHRLRQNDGADTVSD